MTASETIRESLRRKISKEGISYRQAAIAIGCHQQIVTRFITGERHEIRASTLDKICRYVGLRVVASSSRN